MAARLSPPDSIRIEVERAVLALEPLGGVDVHRGILADRRVRTGARLDADHERRVDQPACLQPLGVLGRDEVVRDHGDAAGRRRGSSGSSRSISRVLPEPTGPPIPIRIAALT